MKIKSLRISNVLSFKYCENILDAPEIKLGDGLNILIGHNGSGKSTVIEVINLIFKKILFKPFHLDEKIYLKENENNQNENKKVITSFGNQTYDGFRLAPHWGDESKKQEIKLTIELDDIDRSNIKILEENKEKIDFLLKKYTTEVPFSIETSEEEFTINIELHKKSNTISISPALNPKIMLHAYLGRYNLFKKIIEVANRNGDCIPELYETLTFINCYRNYSSFSLNHTLNASDAVAQQYKNFSTNEYFRGVNTNDRSAPVVFSLVQIRMAKLAQESLMGKMDKEESIEKANNQDFVKSINNKLKLINLRIEIFLDDKFTWKFSFKFFDIRRNEIVLNIDDLSAGEKSIMHLIFECYGRGNMKGGLILIDEPELHLHYHFQHQYLQIIKEINKEQKCQYIIVTHSEVLIDSETISFVSRLSLDLMACTRVSHPQIDDEKKHLIKILDNTRSVHAFFSKKVILVEGDTDRFFFNSALKELHPSLVQEISILSLGGKGNYQRWKKFFEAFGLEVFYIGDFDNISSLRFGENPLLPDKDLLKIKSEIIQEKITNSSSIREKLEKFKMSCEPSSNFIEELFSYIKNNILAEDTELATKAKESNPELVQLIKDKYADKIFILQAGAIESYTGKKHADVNEMIEFCENNLSAWLKNDDSNAQEIKEIFKHIIDAYSK